MLPFFLNAAHSQNFKLPQGVIEVPKCIVQFQPWKGKVLKDTLGGKPLVSINDEPLFAETATMQHLNNGGWQTRWLLTKNRRGKEPLILAEWLDESYFKQQPQPVDDAQVAKVLSAVARANNNSYEGCWNLLTWMGNQLIFVLVKRTPASFVTAAENQWLAAALSVGLTEDNFLYVQWDFNPRCA